MLIKSSVCDSSYAVESPAHSRSLSTVKCRKWSTRSVPLYTGETGQQLLYRPATTTPSSLHSRVKSSLPDAAVGVSHHHTCFVSLRAAVEVLASCVVAVVSSECVTDSWHKRCFITQELSPRRPASVPGTEDVKRKDLPDRTNSQIRIPLHEKELPICKQNHRLC